MDALKNCAETKFEHISGQKPFLWVKKHHTDVKKVEEIRYITEN